MLTHHGTHPVTPCRQIFNISGERYVTFDGIARACAKVGVGILGAAKGCGRTWQLLAAAELLDHLLTLLPCAHSPPPCLKAMGAPEPELVHFNAKDFDFGKKKVRHS
jgi:hypothetical protein